LYCLLSHIDTYNREVTRTSGQVLYFPLSRSKSWQKLERENTKNSALIFYYSPTHAPKITSLSGTFLEKLVSLNSNLFILIY
jgi:hypothetical protein